jgi:hypothetical protein
MGVYLELFLQFMHIFIGNLMHCEKLIKRHIKILAQLTKILLFMARILVIEATWVTSLKTTTFFLIK